MLLRSNVFGNEAAMLKRRAVLTCYCLCFAQGIIAHILDVARRGWPFYYYLGPLFIRIFWTALILLDPVVILLLLRYRRAGLVLAAAVMLLDVAANSYAAFALHDNGFALALPLQCAFLGYILGSLPFLWPTRRLQ